MKLSSEQIELQDLVRRFFAERASPEYRRSRVNSALRMDEVLRTSLLELGLEEGFSGVDAVFSWQELALIAEECGRALLPEPLIEHLVADCMAPREMSSEEHSRYESLSTGGWSTIAPTLCCDLTLDKKGTSASGAIAWTAGGDAPNRIIGFANSKQGIRAIAFSGQGKGVLRVQTSSLDLTTSLHRVELTDAPVVAFSESLSRTLEDGLEALKACEASGLSQRVIDLTCDYAKTREQFGVPIGAFQAVQQKLADIYANSEALRALARFAGWSAAHSQEQRRLTARAAILHAADIAPRVCEVAIQCHGGIGFTWEYDLHLFLRRAKLLQSGFGWSERRAEQLLESVARL